MKQKILQNLEDQYQYLISQNIINLIDLQIYKVWCEFYVSENENECSEKDLQIVLNYIHKNVTRIINDEDYDLEWYDYYRAFICDQVFNFQIISPMIFIDFVKCRIDALKPLLNNKSFDDAFQSELDKHNKNYCMHDVFSGCLTTTFDSWNTNLYDYAKQFVLQHADWIAEKCNIDQEHMDELVDIINNLVNSFDEDFCISFICEYSGIIKETDENKLYLNVPNLVMNVIDFINTISANLPIQINNIIINENSDDDC